MKLRPLALIILCALLLLCGLEFYAASQYRAALSLNSRESISESYFIKLGKLDQWVQIRGEDRSNPVLLWLNGGPGFTTIPSTYFYREWEKYFTVVMWDQRGEGNTFKKNGPHEADSMSVHQMVEDGIELASYLRSRFSKRKIVLLGHSWGSVLGTQMIAERPDLFSAYVGTGQISCLKDDLQKGYQLGIGKANFSNKKTLANVLKDIGPPPYPDLGTYLILLRALNSLDVPIRRPFSLPGIWAMQNALLADFFHGAAYQGAEFSQQTLLPLVLKDCSQPNLIAKVPVIIIEGSDDIVTPNGRRYFSSLKAPKKTYLEVVGAGHNAILGDAAKFLELLRIYLPS